MSIKSQKCRDAKIALLPARAILLVGLVTFVLLILGVAGCTQSSGQASHVVGKVERDYSMKDVALNKQAKLPAYVTAEMRSMYDFALARPDQLQYMPCYCGCGMQGGHKSNLDCYIGGVDKAGKVVFSDHATHCEICLEIARDTKQMSEGGKSLRDIRAYVDKTHGSKGPGTNTPLPPL